MKKKNNHILSSVYLVGSGPGDPGLLTLRAKELLEQADVVLYDYLVNPQILQFCPKAKLDYVGKVGHGHSISQEKIIRRIGQASKKYRKIVRLKGGDPFLFGRGGEEAEALVDAGICFEIVPGVSSALAVPAYAGIPLTHRNFSSALHILTGHEAYLHKPKQKELKRYSHNETIVLLMAVKNLPEHLEQLQGAGVSPETPAAILEWGTYPHQRSVVASVENLHKKAQAAGIESPAVVVIGEVVQLRKKLNWFETKPLFAKKILVTRPAAQAESLSKPLRELGAEVIELPSFEINPLSNGKKLDAALRKIQQYDWLLFTSVNAVDYFFARIKQLKQDIRTLQGIKIASVGPATSQAISKHLLKVDREAKDFSSDALAAALSTREIKGKRILFPRAEIARPNIVADLKQRGAKLDVVAIYRSEPLRYSQQELQKIFKKMPDLLTFTSSLGAEYFFRGLKSSLFKQKIQKIPCAVLGRSTRETAEALGFEVIVMPRQATIENFIEEILKFLRKKT